MVFNFSTPRCSARSSNRLKRRSRSRTTSAGLSSSERGVKPAYDAPTDAGHRNHGPGFRAPGAKADVAKAKRENIQLGGGAVHAPWSCAEGHNMRTPRGVARKGPNGFEVIFERHIPHPPQRVWSALTEPEKIETWFCARVEIERRLGGEIIEHHDHVGVDVHGEVTRSEAPRVFEHTWWFGNAEKTPENKVLW